MFLIMVIMLVQFGFWIWERVVVLLRWRWRMLVQLVRGGNGRQWAALVVAERNRQRVGCDNVTLVRSDWYAALSQSARFDVIVSEPLTLLAGSAFVEVGF